METKELMIGDWYTNSDGDICKVVKNLGNIVWGQGDDVSDSTDDPNPVPLTAEILEKNGFHTNYDHTLLGSRIYRRMCGKYDEYEVVVRMLNGWIKIKSHDDRITDILVIDSQPRFVHQLQHALRLCGLDELADNFKV